MKKNKKLKSKIIDTLVLIAVVSLVLSLANSLAYRTCKTYGYYLPLTYLICNLAKERE